MTSPPSDDDAVATSFQMPAALVSVPQQGEEHIIVSKRDWKRIRSRLETLKKRRREFANAAWAGVGSLLGASLAGLAWAPAYSVMTNAQQNSFSWIWVAIISVGIISILLSIGGFWGAHITEDSIEMSVNELLEEMAGMTNPPVV